MRIIPHFRFSFTTLLFLAWFATNLVSQTVITDNAILSFGKERSIRATLPFSATPATATLTSTTPLLWQQPTVGNYYAAVSTGAITVNQLLTGDLLTAYGCQTVIFYEAPNHPYIVQSINPGGIVQVGGVVCGTTTTVQTELAFGRPRLTIACNSSTGKVTPGVPTQFTIPIPPSFPGASSIRIDFGVPVAIGGGTQNVITLPVTGPVVTVVATYPPDYTASVVVQAVLTTGSFIEAMPLSLNGVGLQADGAMISGVGSFATETTRSGRGSVSIAISVNNMLVRRNGRVTYTFIVTNTSAFPLSNVVIWDSQLGEVATIATLGPGQNAVRNTENTLSSTTKNFAIATAVDPFNNTISDKTSEQIVEVIDPAVTINLWIDPLESKRGRDVILHYDVTNAGNTLLQNIEVTDSDGDVGTIRTLEPTAKASLTRTLTIPNIPGNSLRIMARATATVTLDPGGGDVSADDTETITLVQPGIKLECSIKPDKVKSGKKVTCSYTVTNTGSTDLNADLSDDVFGGVIEAMRNLAPNESRVVTRDEVITGNTMHRASVTAVDPWGDPSNATCMMTASLIFPNIRVSVKANGASSSASVNKGDKVNMTFTVENTGDCALANVKVIFEGQTIETYDVLPAHTSQSPPATEVVADNTTIYSVTVVGMDTDGDVVSSGDKIEVKVSDGMISSLLDKALGNVRSMMNQMIVCSTKVISVKNEFSSRLSELKGAGTDPCQDSRLLALRTEAKSLLQCVREKRDAVVQSFSNDIKTAAEVVAKKVNVDDIVEFLFLAGGQVSDTEQRVTDMESLWSSANCDLTAANVTVTGKVLDENGNPVQNASVTVNGVTTSTDAAGDYRAVITTVIGTVIKVSATGTGTDGKPYGASTSFTFNGGSNGNAGTLVIKGIQKDSRKVVKSLIVAPSDPTVESGISVAFTATAVYDDGSMSDVTSKATWSGGDNNSVMGKTIGPITITAEYDGVSGSSRITVVCPNGKDWNETLNKCIDLASAIDETDGENPCLDREISANLSALSGTVSDMAEVSVDFEEKYNAFKKIFNTRSSNPCSNSVLAAAFVGCENNLLKTEPIVERATDAATNVLYFMGICPDTINKFLFLGFIPSEAAITEHLRNIGSQRGSMRSRIAEMKSLLSSQSCDTTEIRNLGNTLAGNVEDPVILSEGGSGAQEICGDGIDNDGDGLIDEGCSEQSNANLTIYLFDSGSAKDDVFNLSVSGQGDLGNTPEGGARTYTLTLGTGSYLATVTVIKAPDNVGTFTLSVAFGSTVIASQSGSPGVGARIVVPFSIVKDRFTAGTPDSEAPYIDFEKVTHQEKVKEDR